MSFWTKCFLVAVSAWITMFLLTPDDPDIYPELVRNKNIIIIGGSSGIGEQAAYYAATLGASVVVAARRRELLKQVVAKCEEISPNPQVKFGYVVVDFSQPNAGEAVIEQAVAFLGGIDFLILNHAYLMGEVEHKAWNGSAAQRQQMTYSMDVNFYSFIQTDHAMHAIFEAIQWKHHCGIFHHRKDLILEGQLPTTEVYFHLKSMVVASAVEHSAFLLSYATSKSALNAFYTGLRQELIIKKENVSVTVIHLGLINTEGAVTSLRSLARATSRDILKLMSVFPATHPPEGGVELILATARRDAYVYFPRNQMLWLIRIIRVLQKNPDPDKTEQLLHTIAEWRDKLSNYFND